MRHKLAEINKLISVICAINKKQPGFAVERDLDALCISRDNLHNIIYSMQTMMIMSTYVSGYEDANDSILELVIYPIMDTTSSGKDIILLNDTNPDWFAACSRAYFLLDESSEAYLTATTKAFGSNASKVSHVLLNNSYGMLMPVLECSVTRVHAYKNYQHNPTSSRIRVERSASARIIAFNLRSPKMSNMMREIAMIQMKSGKIKADDPYMHEIKEKYEQLKHGGNQSACDGSISSTISTQHSSECTEYT